MFIKGSATKKLKHIYSDNVQVLWMEKYKMR